MKNQNKFLSSTQFFIASVSLFVALLSFLIAAGFNGPENNFLADNWGPALVIFLVLTFALGWWTEGLIEHILMNISRGTAVFVVLVFLLVFSSVGLSSILFSGFTSHALRACGFILVSGFFYRFSIMRPELAGKLRSRE